jgi:hypothetical protein
MGHSNHNSGQVHTLQLRGSKSAFLLAMMIAVGLHTLILLLPLPGKAPEPQTVSTRIDLELVGIVSKPASEKKTSFQMPAPEPVAAPTVRQPELTSIPPRKAPVSAALPASSFEPLAPIQRDLQSMNAAEKASLTHSILSSQFITQDSAADQIFGKQITTISTTYSAEHSRADFHIPEKANMIRMLDQPMQDLPFAYTPDLIYFAYDPGIKGGLQRFWDVITPEFGWRSNNGTEIRCAWLLVIAACGWK